MNNQQSSTKLSIITVCYNNIGGLQKTSESIRSLLSSSSNFEWIVVDGDSSDGTKNLLPTLSHLTRFISEPDSGIYDAMLKGLTMSSGDFIVFMNSGDSIYSEATFTKAIETLSDADVYFFDTLLKTNGFNYLRRARPLDAAWYSVPAVQQSTIYRATSLAAIEWPIQYKITGDMAISAQLLARNCTGEVVHEVFSEFELGGVSTLRPLQLCIEAARVQRRYIRLNPLLIAISFARRYTICMVTYCIFRLKNTGRISM